MVLFILLVIFFFIYQDLKAQTERFKMERLEKLKSKDSSYAIVLEGFKVGEKDIFCEVMKSIGPGIYKAEFNWNLNQDSLYIPSRHLRLPDLKDEDEARSVAEKLGKAFVSHPLIVGPNSKVKSVKKTISIYRVLRLIVITFDFTLV